MHFILNVLQRLFVLFCFLLLFLSVYVFCLQCVVEIASFCFLFFFSSSFFHCVFWVFFVSSMHDYMIYTIVQLHGL